MRSRLRTRNPHSQGPRCSAWGDSAFQTRCPHKVRRRSVRWRLPNIPSGKSDEYGLGGCTRRTMVDVGMMLRFVGPPQKDFAFSLPETTSVRALAAPRPGAPALSRSARCPGTHLQPRAGVHAFSRCDPPRWLSPSMSPLT